MTALLEALRPHQWVKNLLLAVPLLMGHAWTVPGALADLLLAVIAFCLVASGNYLVNDLLDLASDRAHPARRGRPLAPGRVSVPAAALAAAVLTAAGFVLALAVNRAFGLMLLAYLGLALGYSAWLKRVLLVDVMCLAALYTLRLLAGGVATGVEVSSWLLIFAMFLFVSLAFAKRLTELDGAPQAGEAARAARAYVPADRPAFAAAGPAAGMLSILVLAFYVSSEEIRGRYAHPDLLWLLCPLLLYWVLRVWFIAGRGELDYDPLVFATRDPASWVTAAGIVAVFYAAAW